MITAIAITLAISGIGGILKVPEAANKDEDGLAIFRLITGMWCIFAAAWLFFKV